MSKNIKKKLKNRSEKTWVDVPELEEYQYGFHDDVEPIFSTGVGLTRRSRSWNLTSKKWTRVDAWFSFEITWSLPQNANAKTGPGFVQTLIFDSIKYYQRAKWQTRYSSWEDVPDKIKETFERIGIPEAERAYLAGASAQ